MWDCRGSQFLERVRDAWRYVLDERRHDAGCVTDGQLETVGGGAFTISGTVVGQPGEWQADEDVESGCNEETPAAELESQYTVVVSWAYPK